MKFLIAVLAIRYLVNVLSRNGNRNKESETNNNELVRHPAEYLLR